MQFGLFTSEFLGSCHPSAEPLKFDIWSGISWLQNITDISATTFVQIRNKHSVI